MNYFLGVDIGNTKSHALIASEEGQTLALSIAGPGNWESMGWQAAETILDTVVSQALRRAGLSPRDIAGAGFGMAGFDWPEDREHHERIIRSVITPVPPFELVNDAFIGLPAGSERGWGVVVSAGTSCNCYGRNAQGDIGRVTGSSRFGEYAGAGELVRWALVAIARAWSQRGPSTALSAALVKTAGATGDADLLAGLMRDRYHLGPEHAPVVFEAAAQGDAVALSLIRKAGQELGSLVLGVSRQIGITLQAFDVVLAGSFFKGSPLLQEVLAQTVYAEASRARITRLTAPPVVGAALLGMQAAGLDPGPARSRLQASARKILEDGPS